MPCSKRIVAGAALLLCLGGMAACGVGEARLHTDPAEAAEAPLEVSSTSAYLTDLYANYQATSILAADGEAAVPARVAGEVVEILVEEGDRVVQGQLLARLDGQRLKLQVLHSDAEYRQQSSEYRRQKPLADRGLLGKAAVEGLRYEVDALGAALELDRLDYS